MRYLQVLVLLLLMVLLIATSTSASSDWKNLQTDHFTVFYKPEYGEPARKVLEILEFYRPQMEKLTGNEIKNVSVVLEDTGYTNGYASSTFNTIHLFVTPPATGTELGSTENWWSLVGNHEYIHLLSLEKTAGLVGFLKAIFGNVFLPNNIAPGWIIEGITVYGESQISSYQGRLNDGYYDAYIGACVRERRLPSIAEDVVKESIKAKLREVEAQMEKYHEELGL